MMHSKPTLNRTLLALVSLGLAFSSNSWSAVLQSGTAVLDGGKSVKVTLNVPDSGTATIGVDGVTYKVFKQADGMYFADLSGTVGPDGSLNPAVDTISFQLVLESSSSNFVQLAKKNPKDIAGPGWLNLANAAQFQCAADNNAFILKTDLKPKNPPVDNPVGDLTYGNCLTLKDSCPDLSGEWDYNDYKLAGYIHHELISQQVSNGTTVYTFRELGSADQGNTNESKPIPADRQRDLFHTYKYTADGATPTEEGPFSAGGKTVTAKGNISRCEGGALVAEQPFGADTVVIYRFTPKSDSGARKLNWFEGKRAPNQPNSAAVSLAGPGGQDLLKIGN